jgi:rhodanese-related sulfurtransferase
MCSICYLWSRGRYAVKNIQKKEMLIKAAEATKNSILSLLLLSIFWDAQVFAADSCPSEQQYLGSKFDQPAAPQNFDSSCFTSRDISADQISNSALLVDVRTKQRFSESHIVSSVSMPGDTVLSKGYLKTQPLLILGEPYERQRLGQLCSRLKASGFHQAKIVLGGASALSATHKLNQPVGMADSSYLTPREFVLEFFANQARLVVLGADALKQSGFDTLNGATIIDVNDQQPGAAALINVAEGDRYPTIVLGTEADYRVVRSWFGSHQIHNVYFVEGGVDALVKFVRSNRQTQLAMRAVPNRFKCS